MRERLFPRWCTALFTLLPMSELLYLPADGQSVYAAALACTVCALAVSEQQGCPTVFGIRLLHNGCSP